MNPRGVAYSHSHNTPHKARSQRSRHPDLGAAEAVLELQRAALAGSFSGRERTKGAAAARAARPRVGGTGGTCSGYLMSR